METKELHGKKGVKRKHKENRGRKRKQERDRKSRWGTTGDAAFSERKRAESSM